MSVVVPIHGGNVVFNVMFVESKHAIQFTSMQGDKTIKSNKKYQK